MWCLIFVFIFRQDMVTNFRNIIVPETLKCLEINDSTVLEILGNFEEIISSCDSSLDDMIQTAHSIVFKKSHVRDTTSIISEHITQHHATSYHTTPYHTIPHHTIPHHTTLYHTTPHYTTLHCTVPHCTTVSYLPQYLVFPGVN